MAERFKAHAWRACWGAAPRGFESHSLRQHLVRCHFELPYIIAQIKPGAYVSRFNQPRDATQSHPPASPPDRISTTAPTTGRAAHPPSPPPAGRRRVRAAENGEATAGPGARGRLSPMARRATIQLKVHRQIGIPLDDADIECLIHGLRLVTPCTRRIDRLIDLLEQIRRWRPTGRGRRG